MEQHDHQSQSIEMERELILKFSKFTDSSHKQVKRMSNTDEKYEFISDAASVH